MIVYPQRPNRAHDSELSSQELVDRWMRLPPSMQGKYYITHHFREVESELEGMGWGIKIKVPRVISSFVNAVSRIVSAPIKSIEEIAKDALKAAAKVFPPPLEVFKDFDANLIAPATTFVSNVGSVAKESYDNAKAAVVKAAPPFLRPYVGVVVDPVKAVLNPASTIKLVTDPVSTIAKGVVLPTVKRLADTVKPVYNAGMAVVDSVYITPVVQIIDNYVASALPPGVRNKVLTVAHFAQRAGRRKMVDKDLKAATFSYIMLAAAPQLMSWRLLNGTIDTLKKDAILGPFIKDLDRYSGGLLSSGQRLVGTPDDVLHEKDVNWKQVAIDALKVYLATVSVSSLLTSMATTAAGEKTGLDQTPMGRDVLAVGVAYYGGTAGGGSMWNADAFKGAVMGQAENVARRETIKEANNRGIIKDADLANTLFTYAKSGGESAVLMNWMSERSDHEFQKMLEEQALKQTGYPVKYKDMVKIYNFDYARAIADIARETPRILSQIAQVNENIAKNLMIFGSNVVDELARTPANLMDAPENVARELGVFLTNVGAEIARTPANVAGWFEGDGKPLFSWSDESKTSILDNIANELARTPDNIEKIASNVGREVAKGADNVWEELKRTPGNLQKIAENIARELGRGLDNILREIENFDWQEFLDKYGNILLKLLQGPGANPAMVAMFDNEAGQQVIALPQKKKSNKGPMIGLLAVLAAGAYFTMED